MIGIGNVKAIIKSTQRKPTTFQRPTLSITPKAEAKILIDPACTRRRNLRAYAAPASKRGDILQRAFNTTMKDPEFWRIKIAPGVNP
jgi:hypothetical protein